MKISLGHILAAAIVKIAVNVILHSSIDPAQPPFQSSTHWVVGLGPSWGTFPAIVGDALDALWGDVPAILGDVLDALWGSICSVISGDGCDEHARCFCF